VIVFPNCKINIGLHIVRKRTDGFHDLETCFYPVNLRDALEVISLPEAQEIKFTQSGLSVEGTGNTCIKAYELLKSDFPRLPAVHIHLHKVIPMGAGLGGGSADGAFTLRLLNEKYGLDLDEKALLGYALQLGSDAPFFIRNKPSFAGGRGEIMEDAAVDLSRYHLLLINPGIHVATPWAFSKIRPQEGRQGWQESLSGAVTEWRDRITNDFEAPVFAEWPEIGAIKKQLYDAGALYASLSGSGATVYGIFENAPQIEFPSNYFTQHLPPTS
jgi:4-diphosphocytidyl-2-C-methyl-D-erythritol kinase